MYFFSCTELVLCTDVISAVQVGSGSMLNLKSKGILLECGVSILYIIAHNCTF